MINVFIFTIESSSSLLFNYQLIYYTQWTPKITTILEKALNSTLINSVGTWNGRQKIIIINQNEKMKQKWIPRKMKEATWFGWSRIFGGRFFSSGTMCIYLYVFLNQLVMWKHTSISYSTTYIAYPSWFFTRTSQCSIKMKKNKMNMWNKINMDIQKIRWWYNEDFYVL